MTASKPTYPHLLQQIYPYTLKNQLGTLADGLGCYPFDNRAFASHVCLALFY